MLLSSLVCALVLLVMKGKGEEGEICCWRKCGYCILISSDWSVFYLEPDHESGVLGGGLLSVSYPQYKLNPERTIIVLHFN